MRIKIALLAALAAIASLALVQPASAKTIKLYVTPKYGYTDYCRSPGVLGFRFTFGAKFQRKNSPYPKSVKFKYTVTDLATGATVTTGRATLTKRNKWKTTSAPVRLATGGTYQYKMEGSFKSPSTGKTLKNTDILPSTGPDKIPTDAELDAQGIVFPACV